MTPTLSPGLLFALLCSLIFVPGRGFAQAVREAYVKASNTDAFDGFGSSVAISGTTAVAGALFESSSATGVNGNQADNSADVAGAAYVFVRGASTWTQQAYLKASNTDSFDGFGRVVAISGDTIAVGARGESSAATGVNGNQTDNSAASSGAVYIFVRSGSIWTQQAYIKASDTVAGQRFGSAVSLDGDVLAVGANSLSGAPGAVYVFRRNGTTWAQEARLQPLDVAAQGPGGLQARDFGNTLSISGDFIAVPAPTHTNALQSDGVVYVFRRNTGVWAQEAMLNANPSPVRGMSDKVSISGSTLAVGSTYYQTGNGVSTPITTTYGAYLFTRSGTGWTQQGHIQEDQLTPNSASAAGIAMQGDVLLLGGAERVWNYVRSGTSWVKTATFDALDASRSDAFGRNLAVSGGRGIIAAPNEDSTTIGINGLEGGIGATQSGAVYLYSGLGPQSALELTVTVDPAATAICKEATLTMTLRNQGQQVITSIEAPAGLVPVGNIVAGISQMQSPPGLFSLTAGQTKVLTWKIMGTKAGTASYDIRYQGRLNGAELVQSAIIRTPAVVFSGLELEVNSTGDEADADLSDNCPDVDLARPGLQSTLRSVLQTVNATTLPAGQRARVSFAIPGTGVPRISPRTLLPPVTKPVEILGNTQAGGWVELNGALVSSPGDGLEVRSASTIRGLVVNGWKRAALVLTGTGGNEVLGCRLGTDAAGATAIPNGFGVVVLSPDNVVGGTGSLGNLISGNLVSGVSLEKLTTGGLPNGNRIIGNRIGTSADGTQTVLQKSGIVVANGADNLIGESGLGNLISGHKLVGVSIEGADSKGNQIQTNLVGTTADGSAELPNNIGIALSKGASANTIGGDASTLGNLISGNNASGVLVAEAAFSNKIQGNLIGLNRSGTLALANVLGVYIEDGISNRIGGGIVSHKNIISGNTSAGITLSNSKGAVPQQRSCNGTIIEGNWIGLSKDGLHTVPNGGPMPLSNAGIVLNYYAQNTTIGGPLPGQGNVISGNDGFGIVINSGPALTNTVQGNTIGLLPDGITPAGNSGSGFGTATGSSAQTIIGGSSTGASNRIAYNGGHGVDLRGTSRSVPSPVQANHIFLNKGRAIALADRRPLNDNGDADTGPNGLQNFPFLRTARNLSGATVVLMDLKTFPLNKSFRIDFFHHRDGDPQSGGDAWINSISILTGTAADALYTASLPLQFSSSAITCTATDAAGNTSEYSNAVIVSAATDRDHDGIPDDQETAGGKVPTRTRGYSVGDANGDGGPDVDQANVSTMLLPDTGWVCLAGPAGSTLTNMAIADYASYARLPAPWQTKREIVTFNMAGAPAGTTTLTWIEAPGSEVQQIWRWTGSAWLSASPVITVDDASGTRRFTVTLPTPAGTQLVSLARAYLPPPLPVLSISSNTAMVAAAQQQGGASLPDFTSYPDAAPAGPIPMPTTLVPATTVILLLTPPADGVIQWSRDLGATEEWQDIFPATRLTQGRYKFVFPNSEPHGFFRLRSLEH